MTSKTKIQFCDLESDLYSLSETIDNSKEIKNLDQRASKKAIDTAIKLSRRCMNILTEIEKSIELLNQDGIGSKITVRDNLVVCKSRLTEVFE